MKVHLVDGTYELFRQHFGQVARHGDAGPFDAAVAVVASTLQLVSNGATHIGVASDHVIESFRNRLYAGYKTGEGTDPVLLAQIPVMEEALVACGFTVWPMVEWEADDALGAAAAVAAEDPRVEQVLIITPDKDLGQCVQGTRVVQYDRRKDEIIDEAAVIAKFGAGPASIADYLALVGDTADGYPGLPGWGAKSAATVLAKFASIETIPTSHTEWDIPGLRGAEKLARTLSEQRDAAVLFREIATIALDVPVGRVDEWKWQGPTGGFAAMAERLG
ncbi:MAG: 5'-3' exonuclease H3TH domain-containing protein, partial [Actinomycetota bacterium]